MTYIKLYHTIWQLCLSPNAFRTYCALLRFMNTDNNYANVAMYKLAAAVGISEKSISRGIRELQEKNLLSIVEKHHNGHRLANGYIIHPQSGKYTKLPVSILFAPVTASGFMLYAYLLKCADSTRLAFPSLRGIASAIGITVQTVIEQIKQLAKLKLLNKRNQIKKDSSFGHNLYQLFDSIVHFVKKEKTRPDRVSPQTVAEATSNCKSNILLKSNIVKGVFKIFSIVERGYSNFVRTCTKPISYIQKKIKGKFMS